MEFNCQYILTHHLLPVVFMILLNNRLGDGCFTHIFSFGDSHIDTGNKLEALGDKYHYARYLPYGETYFGHPTGRFSDGRVIVDFLAQAYGLPLIPAYLKGQSTNSNFPNGANFAEAGATAVYADFYVQRGYQADSLNFSLDVQLKWFKQLLSTIFNNPGRSEMMRRSLFLLGEIGGNDYNSGLLYGGRSFDEVVTFVPFVIESIGAAVQELIDLGGRTFIVPSQFAVGCVPSYLTLFRTNKQEDYEPDTGCLKWLNDFAKYHNGMLVEKLDNLRTINPNVTIIYADYFGALMDINRHPRKFGFEHHLKACCGGKGPYNYDPNISCGRPGSTTCSNSSAYVSWDGVHLTEATYKILTDGLLHGPHAYPPLSNACDFIERDFPNILHSSTKYTV